jgi:hypothetical protein
MVKKIKESSHTSDGPQCKPIGLAPLYGKLSKDIQTEGGTGKSFTGYNSTKGDQIKITVPASYSISESKTKQINGIYVTDDTFMIITEILAIRNETDYIRRNVGTIPHRTFNFFVSVMGIMFLLYIAFAMAFNYFGWYI